MSNMYDSSDRCLHKSFANEKDEIRICAYLSEELETIVLIPILVFVLANK